MKIQGCILAGGKNTRYHGQNKALIKVEGITIIERTINKLERIFDDVFIITNTPLDLAFAGKPCFADIFPNIGPLGGIHAGLHHCSTDAIFIVSCDMPFLSKTLIQDLVKEYLKQKPDILIPQKGSKIEPLHGIYSKRILPDLQKYLLQTNIYKIRLFYENVNCQYYQIPYSDHNKDIFFNINSPEDLNQIL